MVNVLDVISWVLTIFSVGGNFLLAKKNKLVFPIWIVANVGWVVVILLTSKNIAQLVMYGIYTYTSVCGWVQWSKDEKKEKEKS